MTLRDLKLRIRALVAPHRTERELNEELSFHLERETRRLIDAGASPEDARLTAQARFGSTTVVADHCRDQRGIAPIETTLRDVGYAARGFVRAPLASVTIIATVAVGLGLIGVLFTVLNVFLFRVDNVPDINEMYLVERPRTERDERRLMTRPEFEAMREETRAFAGLYAQLDVESRIDGRPVSGGLVTGNFFQVLGVGATMGRALLPSDDQTGAYQPVIVLSHDGWTEKLDSDPNVVGRKLTIHGAPHEIIGVMPKGFRGLAVGAPDYWAPLSMLAGHEPEHRGREDAVGVSIIGRLMPGTTPASARAQLEAWYAQRLGDTTADRPDLAIELSPRRGTIPQPMEAVIVFTPLFFAFGLILLIGCANVANLLLARGVTRQKEIGVRLSLGASRRRIVRQLLTESLMLALAAAAVGFMISRWALDAAITFVMRNLPPDVGDVVLNMPAADWRVALFMVAGAILATAMFGVMPALQATRIDPVRTMRGEIVKDARPVRSRNVLIGLQVAASALLLICSAIFLRSSLASTTVDPGFRTADTIVIDVNEPRRELMVQAVKNDPSVVAAGVMWPHVLGFPRAVSVQLPTTKIAAAYRLVSPEYFEILDIPILQGRPFTAAESTGQQPVAIINESLAATLYPGASAIGQTLQLEPNLESPTMRQDEPPLMARAATIVGVSRDVPGFRMSDVREANLYFPVHAGVAKTNLLARVHGDPDQVRRTLLERLLIVDPNMGQILTLRTMARMEFYFLNLSFIATLVLGGLALALTVSGLFSVLSYMVEQRTKEIGVRMALGASSKNVTRMVIAQTSRPVIIGLAIGTTLVLALATALLSIPSAGLIGEVIHVLDPLAYLGSLTCIILACLLAAAIPAARAARVDPMRSLRQE